MLLQYRFCWAFSGVRSSRYSYPVTAPSGVRSSWLICARNSLFARLALSASSRACRICSSAVRRFSSSRSSVARRRLNICPKRYGSLAPHGITRTRIRSAAAPESASVYRRSGTIYSRISSHSTAAISTSEHSRQKICTSEAVWRPAVAHATSFSKRSEVYCRNCSMGDIISYLARSYAASYRI